MPHRAKGVREEACKSFPKFLTKSNFLINVLCCMSHVKRFRLFVVSLTIYCLCYVNPFLWLKGGIRDLRHCQIWRVMEAIVLLFLTGPRVTSHVSLSVAIEHFLSLCFQSRSGRTCILVHGNLCFLPGKWEQLSSYRYKYSEARQAHRNFTEQMQKA